jgi:branched-chain amino acid transport system substrate-binding protein
MPLILLYLFLAFQAQRPVPYAEFGGKGAGFYGDAGPDSDPAALKSIRIGVLGPSKSKEGIHQRAGVQIAIQLANDAGGFRLGRVGMSAAGSQGIPYEMVFREDDGPWGMAARQVVQLAYEDRVWAIIGALDGQHTHMAELVVSKAWVPVISPSASDASIEYANVPWVFRAAPADSAQAEALLNLAEKRNYRHLIVLTETEREAHTGFLRLKEKLSRRSEVQMELHLEYSPLAPAEIVPRIKNLSFDCLVVWGRSESALALIREIREAGITVPVLGPASLAVQSALAMGPALGEIIVASSCDLSLTAGIRTQFDRLFGASTGDAPSATAYYSYDVARMVIRALEEGGLNRASVRNRLSTMTYEGLVGRIEFNSLGGNLAPPILLNLKENQWVRLD